MDSNSEAIDKLIDELETNGELTINRGKMNLFIQAVDDKEGYAYVSSTNKEFKNSKEAVEWAVKQ